MEGSLIALPDCMASHIYNAKGEHLRSKAAQLIKNRSEITGERKFPLISITSLASFSSKAFLSVVLKASSVLVLKSVPVTGQQ